MNIGDTVKIKKCDLRPTGFGPELVSENAEIVEMQLQQYEKYRVYPIWAKMTSGEHKGRVCGFREDEIELIPKGNEGQKLINNEERQIIKTQVIEQLEEIIKGTMTAREFAEVERIIQEAKGKVLLGESSLDFWEEKTPCWEMCSCPEIIKSECPAFKHRFLPCWEIEGTYCKLDDYGATGQDTSICEVCRVYKRWSHGDPIKIKLFGEGINTPLRFPVARGD